MKGISHYVVINAGAPCCKFHYCTVVHTNITDALSSLGMGGREGGRERDTLQNSGKINHTHPGRQRSLQKNNGGGATCNYLSF